MPSAQIQRDDVFRLGNKHARSSKRIFLEAADKTKDAVILSDLERAFLVGSIETGMTAVPLETFVQEIQPIGVDMRRAVLESGELTITHLPAEALTTTSRAVTFDLLAPSVVDHLRTDTARMVTEVMESTREGIRQTISDAVVAGLHPREAARQVREQIGLHSRQVTANRRLRENLVEQGLPEARIERMVARHAKRALDWRAENIARTEMFRAVNFGRQQMWEQAVESKLLLPDKVERRWETADDERVCPICGPFDGKRADINEEFTAGGYSFVTPPAHPSCRCTVIIVPKRRRS